MAPVTACLPCRSLKAKCDRPTGDQICYRCERLRIDCQTIPRQFGRKPGSRNLPRVRTSIAPSDSQTARGDAGSLPGDIRPVAEPSRDDSTASTPMAMAQDTVDGENFISSDPATRSRVSPDGSMLNVLARAADEMPLRGNEPTDSRRSSSLLDRKAFLEQFQKAARTLDPDPYAGISVLEQGFDQLLASDDSSTQQLGDQIVHARIDQPRRDLRNDYDVLMTGLISDGELKDLFEVYWSRCNPLIRILDPKIYTFDVTRSRSALLLTAMCQVAAQTLPESGHSLGLCARLDQHIEYLVAEIVKFGYQSIEICQGLVIFAAWLRGTKQQQTWQIMSQAMAMAIELRLDSAANFETRNKDDLAVRDSAHRETRNQQRTWMVLVEWDRVMAFIRGRRPILRASLTRPSAKNTLTNWWKDDIALNSDAMLCAALQLRETIALLQRNTHEALLRGTVIGLIQYQSEIDSQLNQWRNDWLQHLSEGDFTCLYWSLMCRVSNARRYRTEVYPLRPVDDAFREPSQQRRLRRHGKGRVPSGRNGRLQKCAPSLGWVYSSVSDQKHHADDSHGLYLIGYTAFCSLRIIVSATVGPETPDINVEAFHLSILAAVALRLCNLKIHPHLASISHGLGVRLLNASRKFATRSFSKQADPSNGVTMDDIFNQLFVHQDLADATYGPPTATAHNDAGHTDAGDFAMSFDFSHFGETCPFLEQGSSGVAPSWDDPFGFQIPYH